MKKSDFETLGWDPSNIDKIESDKKYIIGKHEGMRTKYDDENPKSIPPKYVGFSFMEMEHSDITNFLLSNNVRKFEIAYWAERSQTRAAFKGGFFVGFALAIFIAIGIVSL